MRAVWVNEEGGVTFRVGDGVEFIKVANGGTARFTDEACRLRWAASYAAVPQVLGVGLDQTPDGDWAWLRTAGLRGLSAVHPHWLASPEVAVRAIGAGLRTLHDQLPVRSRRRHVGRAWASHRRSIDWWSVTEMRARPIP